MTFILYFNNNRFLKLFQIKNIKQKDENKSTTVERSSSKYLKKGNY